MHAMQTAGIGIKEFSKDPSSGEPPLRQHTVGIGPTPAESAAFGADTRFVELTVGVNLDSNSTDHQAIVYELGLDPLADLTAKWRAGALPATTLPLVNGTRVSLPVGPGARLAFLGFNLGVHGGYGHPPSPKMSP